MQSYDPTMEWMLRHSSAELERRLRLARLLAQDRPLRASLPSVALALIGRWLVEFGTCLCERASVDAKVGRLSPEGAR
jgi:hypothetical protein